MNDYRRSQCNRNAYGSTDALSQFPLAMAYVPWQYFGQTYDLPKALSAGTIFPELNKPFSGKRGNCR